MTEDEITRKAQSMGLALQLQGLTEADAWKVLCRALGLFTGITSPDAGALEQNIERGYQNVEAAARAAFNRKRETEGKRQAVG